jgi:hypothetical protein
MADLGLFHDDPYQLPVCPFSSFCKDLLKRGFDPSLRHCYSRRKLFVRKTLEHARKHLLVSFDGTLCLIAYGVSTVGTEGPLQSPLVQPDRSVIEREKWSAFKVYSPVLS